MNFDTLQKVITAFEADLSKKATDSSTLDGLKQADDAAQAKIDAATAAKAATAAAFDTQNKVMIDDDKALAADLRAIAAAAIDDANLLDPPAKA